MLVSAIVSTYNAQRFIKGRLENLLKQTLYRKGELEVIVIDSGSQEDEDDEVQRLSLEYQNIRYLRTAQRETVYEAWNRGISMARGRYFINANTDDRFTDEALERLAGALEIQPEFDAAYGNWFYTEIENDRIDSVKPRELFKYHDFYPPLLFYYQVTSHALMIRCRVFSEVGLFNDSMKVFGDRDWVFRFASARMKAIHIKCPVGLYLKRGDSLERANRNVGDREFNHLLQYYLQPERFVKLHGYHDLPEKEELAQLYALTATLGTHFAVSVAYEDSGNLIDFRLPQQSLIFFRRALLHDPDNFMARHNLAIAAALQGGTEFAIKELSALLDKHGLSKKTMADLQNNLKFVKNDCRDISAYHWHEAK